MLPLIIYSKISAEFVQIQEFMEVFVTNMISESEDGSPNLSLSIEVTPELTVTELKNKILLAIKSFLKTSEVKLSR
jgi:hypothetical protein